MNANLQPSPSSGRMVDDITHLRLEYFERHIQTRDQEVKNEYNQALSKVLEAEKALHRFASIFNGTR
jgi:hypothetical protein